MEKRNGYLTVYSADRAEIYGEFADATWETVATAGGLNRVFTGIASEGTMETFNRVNADGIDHVEFDFDSDGKRYSGKAQLLKPIEAHNASPALVRIETGTEPSLAAIRD